MKHLTFDEIIDFISFEKLDADTMNLASAVNGHICECQECFELVKSLQLIYEELQELGKASDFVKCATERYGNNLGGKVTKINLEQKNN